MKKYWNYRMIDGRKAKIKVKVIYEHPCIPSHKSQDFFFLDLDVANTFYMNHNRCEIENGNRNEYVFYSKGKNGKWIAFISFKNW